MKLKNTLEEQLNRDDQPAQKKSPLHRQLFSRLRLAILVGTLGAGTKLPSRGQLTKRKKSHACDVKLHQMALLQKAKPIMESLAKDSSEAVYLAIPGDKDLLFVESGF